MNFGVWIYVIGILSLLATFCETAGLPSVISSDLGGITDKNNVIECRKTCFAKILNDKTFEGNLVGFLKCKSVPNCFMCWDYCRAVYVAQKSLARAMCNDVQFCTVGCKVACRFHRLWSLISSKPSDDST